MSAIDVPNQHQQDEVIDLSIFEDDDKSLDKKFSPSDFVDGRLIGTDNNRKRIHSNNGNDDDKSTQEGKPRSLGARKRSGHDEDESCKKRPAKLPRSNRSMIPPIGMTHATVDRLPTSEERVSPHDRTIQTDAILAARLQEEENQKAVNLDDLFDDRLQEVFDIDCRDADALLAAQLQNEEDAEECYAINDYASARRMEESDASLAAKFHEEELEEDLKIRESERQKMLSTVEGRATLFVEKMLEIHDTYASNEKISPVARDDIVFMAERMLRAQEKFRACGEDTTVDVGYHYTDEKHMNTIRIDGLLTREDRLANGSGKHSKGAVFGDGVYTANNPIAFRMFGPVGLIVARLKGKCYRCHYGGQNRSSPAGVNTTVGNKTATVENGDYHDEVVLHTSAQVLPLARFCSSLTQLWDGESIALVATIHRLVEAAVEEYFNGVAAPAKVDLLSVNLPWNIPASVQNRNFSHQRSHYYDPFGLGSNQSASRNQLHNGTMSQRGPPVWHQTTNSAMKQAPLPLQASTMPWGQYLNSSPHLVAVANQSPVDMMKTWGQRGVWGQNPNASTKWTAAKLPSSWSPSTEARKNNGTAGGWGPKVSSSPSTVAYKSNDFTRGWGQKPSWGQSAGIATIKRPPSSWSSAAARTQNNSTGSWGQKVNSDPSAQRLSLSLASAAARRGDGTGWGQKAVSSAAKSPSPSSPSTATRKSNGTAGSWGQKTSRSQSTSIAIAKCLSPSSPLAAAHRGDIPADGWGQKAPRAAAKSPPPSSPSMATRKINGAAGGWGQKAGWGRSSGTATAKRSPPSSPSIVARRSNGTASNWGQKINSKPSAQRPLLSSPSAVVYQGNGGNNGWGQQGISAAAKRPSPSSPLTAARKSDGAGGSWGQQASWDQSAGIATAERAQLSLPSMAACRSNGTASSWGSGASSKVDQRSKPYRPSAVDRSNRSSSWSPNANSTVIQQPMSSPHSQAIRRSTPTYLRGAVTAHAPLPNQLFHNTPHQTPPSHIVPSSSASSSFSEVVTYDAPRSLYSSDSNVLRELTKLASEDECPICLNLLRCVEKVVCLRVCSHQYHLECITACLKHSNKCPSCRIPVSEPQGKSPSGTMTIKKAPSITCSGFSPGALVIKYRLRAAAQEMYHDNPGTMYAGVTRIAYLPYSDEGKKLLLRLKYCFLHGLTFTVGTSLTTGATNSVTWASVHHKTRPSGGAHGYPDTKYFDNCNNELDALGVPAACEM